MLADVDVRLATKDHALQIAEMSRDFIEHGLGWGWTRDRIVKALREPEVNAAVVLRESMVLAFGIMRYGERHAHLELLAVRPDHRRLGLASAIVGWLESVAAVAGMERILVECRKSNDAARCLYLEHGYHERRIEPAMYSPSEDGIRLEKWLRPRPSGDGGELHVDPL